MEAIKSWPAIKRLISIQDWAQGFAKLSEVADPSADFPIQSKYLSQFAKIDLSLLGLKKIRVAIVGSTTLDHVRDLLAFYLAREGFEVDIYLAPFGSLFPEILDPMSGLYAFKPDVVWIFSGYRDAILPSVASELPDSRTGAAIDKETSRWTKLWETIRSRSDCAIIQNNFDLPTERSAGNFDASWSQGTLRLLRKLNDALATARTTGVTLFDLDHISALIGKRQWNDSRFWYHSKHAFSVDAAGEVAFQCAKQVVAIYGQSKKCIVLDLDNTLWGGVIGDDGLAGIALGNGAVGEAFVAFQAYVLKLKQRGIILAVCSKNNEDVAQDVFIKHPDMVLKLEDISMFVANWQNKADNIANIAKVLNIGLDSIVFVDDNPAERALVKEMLPQVSVPELPVEPENYIQALERHLYFETTSLSNEDSERSNYYRENAQRALLQESVTDLSNFLKNLDMTAEWGTVDAFHLSRFTQLINKSNQFNLTTIRYSESEISARINDTDKWICLYFKLKDRFGDNGLIASVLLEKQSAHTLVIDTWAMSCRVLSRTMEEFIMECIIRAAKKLGNHAVIGKFRPTAKNKMVATLYNRLGLTLENEENGATNWRLVVSEAYVPTRSFIKDSPVNKDLI
jgi:FkbH-like protein